MYCHGFRTKVLFAMLVGLVVVGSYLMLRETSHRRVLRLLNEQASLPGGNIDLLYFGRNPQDIQEDWDSLGVEELPALFDSLHDPNPRKRYLSAGKIGDLGDKHGIGPLLQMLRDNDFLVRTWAVTALGKIGDPIATKPVIGCLSDEAFPVRQASIVTLGRLGDPRAIDPLIHALDDKEVVIQVEAIRSLSLLGDRKAVGPIQALMEREESDMIQTAGKQAIEKLSANLGSR